MLNPGAGRIGLLGERGSESGSERRRLGDEASGESSIGEEGEVLSGVVEARCGGGFVEAGEVEVEVEVGCKAELMRCSGTGTGASLSLLLRRSSIGLSCGPSHCPGRSGISLRDRSGIAGRLVSSPAVVADAVPEACECGLGATNRNASSSIKPARSFIELVCFHVTFGGSCEEAPSRAGSGGGGDAWVST